MQIRDHHGVKMLRLQCMDKTGEVGESGRIDREGTVPVLKVDVQPNDV